MEYCLSGNQTLAGSESVGPQCIIAEMLPWQGVEMKCSCQVQFSTMDSITKHGRDPLCIFVSLALETKTQLNFHPTKMNLLSFGN